MNGGLCLGTLMVSQPAEGPEMFLGILQFRATHAPQRTQDVESRVKAKQHHLNSSETLLVSVGGAIGIPVSEGLGLPACSQLPPEVHVPRGPPSHQMLHSM